LHPGGAFALGFFHTPHDALPDSVPNFSPNDAAGPFVLLGHGLEQRFYDLERHLDPQTQRSAPDRAFGRFYTDASINWAFIALVYLICLLNLLNVFSRL
jgi:hypothetical protein